MDGEDRPADDDTTAADAGAPGGPPWTRPGGAPAPGWSPFGTPSTPPGPPASPPSGGPDPSPFGVPAAPPGVAPGGPAGFAGGAPGVVVPGAYAPGVGTPAVPQVTPPPARPTSRRTLGLPPSLGLATALMSFPAVGAFLYGIFGIIAGVFLAGSTSDSSDFGVDASDFGAGFALFGAVLLLIGVIGLYGVVMVMAANSIGRTICTVFLVLGVFGALLATATGGAFTLVFAVPYYALCFWALWGRPGQSVF